MWQHIRSNESTRTSLRCTNGTAQDATHRAGLIAQPQQHDFFASQSDVRAEAGQLFGSSPGASQHDSCGPVQVSRGPLTAKTGLTLPTCATSTLVHSLATKSLMSGHSIFGSTRAVLFEHSTFSNVFATGHSAFGSTVGASTAANSTLVHSLATKSLTSGHSIFGSTRAVLFEHSTFSNILATGHSAFGSTDGTSSAGSTLIAAVATRRESMVTKA
eukprot:CAMPEP_0174698924 /NCGR_PEP_ID=MMETSP1094-20130205/4372_1 /TAXON_ID=156173 /ORGANISM="Chrysochromulina brevifilum, Strain UTEX LB 985" /LENGTH=215 /DNA_ID=CAMNT_0015896167 /DNA_START=250 /DNA_END=898 /DNA_ORIENTATION=-